MASMVMAATMNAALTPIPFDTESTRGSVPTTEARLLAYMPMVRAIASRLRRGLPPHVELDDLISAGVIGLIDAVTKCEVDRGLQFRTYAEYRVRGAILDSLRQQDWAPRHLRRSSREIKRAIATCTVRLGCTPEEDEIAAELNVSVAELRSTVSELRALEVSSLQVRNCEDSDAEIACMADPMEPGALFHCLQDELRQQLMTAIEALTESERLVITLSYYEELTLKEIAKILGLGQSRVSQMRSRAVCKLRAAIAGCS